MLLQGIWQGSLILAAGSIGAVLILYVRRLFIDAIEARLGRRRADIRAKIIASLSSDRPAAWTLPMATASDERIMLGIATELLQSLSGTLHTRILTLLNTAIDIGRMLAVLHTGSPENRAKVAARLFWSRDPRVAAGLKAALADSNPDVVLASANSLIAMGEYISIADFVETLATRDMLDHRGAREVIRRLAPRQPDAIAAMIRGQSPIRAIIALTALGPDSDPAMIKLVAEIASGHSDQDVRATAVRALGMSESSPAETISAALDDPAWQVRSQAAIAAGRLRLKALIPKLTNCLESEHWWVQWRAAQSLAKMGAAGEAALRGIPFDSRAAGLVDAAIAEMHSA